MIRTVILGIMSVLLALLCFSAGVVIGRLGRDLGPGARNASPSRQEPPESTVEVDDLVRTDTAHTHGIDVSHYQGLINWRHVLESGVAFAWIKATDGTAYVDARFEPNWRGAREAGLARGAYHFFRADESPLLQAEYFLEQVGPLRTVDLPPAVDVEIRYDFSKDTLAARVREFLEHVQQRFGRMPVIYASADFYEANFGSGFERYPVWIAEYDVERPRIQDWRFWQHSSSGRVRGVDGDVDLNVFDGQPGDLEAYIRNSSTN